MLTEDATLDYAGNFAAVIASGPYPCAQRGQLFHRRRQRPGAGGRWRGRAGRRRLGQQARDGAFRAVVWLAVPAVNQQAGDLAKCLAAVHAQMFTETRADNERPSGTTIAGIWAPKGSRGPGHGLQCRRQSGLSLLQGPDRQGVPRPFSLSALAGRRPGGPRACQADDRAGAGHLRPAFAPISRRSRFCRVTQYLICTDGLSGVDAAVAHGAASGGVTELPRRL